MEYKQKLKTRLYLSVLYIIFGIAVIIGANFTKTDNSFVSSFGIGMTVMGIARTRNYFLITKNDETLKKQQIYETDERNLSIQSKAKSLTFSIYVLLSGTAVIVLSFCGIHDLAKQISFSVLLLVVIYWISYLIYQKKS